MGRKKGFAKKKDKYDALTESFKDAVAQSSTDEIRKRISQIAILDVTERQVLKNDPAVLSARQSLKDVMEPYRENLKSFKLQIEFCKQVLDDKGGGTTAATTALKSPSPGATLVSHKPLGSDKFEPVKVRVTVGPGFPVNEDDDTDSDE